MTSGVANVRLIFIVAALLTPQLAGC